MIKSVLVALVALFSGTAAQADDFEQLCKDGYGVLITTDVDGTFEGCDHGRRINFTNGLVFVCEEYSYAYSYNPDAYILKHVGNGDIKVVIDDEEYEGTLYRR